MNEPYDTGRFLSRDQGMHGAIVTVRINALVEDGGDLFYLLLGRLFESTAS